MSHLYELTEQQRQLKEVAANGDLPAEALNDTFQALEGEFNEKAVSIIHVVNDIDADIESIDNEIKRLQARKKTATNKKESIREYLRSNMEASGITKIDCPLFSISLAKGRDTVVIDDESLLPDELVDVEVKLKPKKADILKAIQAGEDIAGARIEKSKTSLRIK